MRPTIIIACAAIALGAFAGGFFYARNTEGAPSSIREVETLKETVTVFRTFTSESERQKNAVERVIERRVAVPCRCQSCPESAPQTVEEWPKGEQDIAPSVTRTGTVVLNERIVERAIGTTERLKIGAFSGAAASDSTVRESVLPEAPKPARWRVSALAGYDWTDAVPVYGLAAGMRLLGPVELGVWATVSQRLHGAAGVSVSAVW